MLVPPSDVECGDDRGHGITWGDGLPTELATENLGTRFVGGRVLGSEYLQRLRDDRVGQVEPMLSHERTSASTGAALRARRGMRG